MRRAHKGGRAGARFEYNSFWIDYNDKFVAELIAKYETPKKPQKFLVHQMEENDAKKKNNANTK